MSDHVGWLVRMRWSAIAGQAAAVLAARWLLELALPLPALFALIGVAAASNLALAWRKRPVGQAGLAGVMALDILILTALLYLTGGAENPFSFLYLIQIALAAVMLRPRTTWALVALSLAGSAFLFVDRRPLPHDQLMRLHLEGMWVAFGVSAGFIVYFLLRVTRELAAARERAARQARLGALATLAAGAAHELATPLSTIAVAARELERQELAGEVREDVELIRAQVERCRKILEQMAADAGAWLGEGLAPVSVAAVVAAALDGVDGVAIHIDDAARAVELEAPPRALAQALRGVIQNARDASDDVQVSATLAGGAVRIAVRDAGAGMSAQVLARAGEPFFTTKPPGRGMGLGLFLGRAVVERLGGELRLDSSVGRGTVAVLTLPRLG